MNNAIKYTRSVSGAADEIAASGTGILKAFGEASRWTI